MRSLQTVVKILDFNIENFLLQRAVEQNKPVVALDWGCGTGRAAEKLGSQIGTRGVVYGCGDDSFQSWRRRKNCKLFQATQEDSLRYVKNGSLDLLYSCYGMIHVEDPQYALQWIPKLKIGGKIVFNSHDLEKLKMLAGQHATITESHSFGQLIAFSATDAQKHYLVEGQEVHMDKPPVNESPQHTIVIITRLR